LQPLASCHISWFLSIPAKYGFVGRELSRQATGVLAKNAEGKLEFRAVKSASSDLGFPAA
jgi:hypothetical protein